ncbi:polar amino acid transport system substrate-binding protein [Herbihabitans rhizosphaerae]|uniref:Polar amino acid transport system substrate-binding protein n=1 Tax=Herbihabitans rhizosphaerae TaxID=1872711 RepID=A0A4Q7KMA4_9PSEU|nr:ABC transporter substrate-binding protein [Herbihabitans rhizosphaerae]RZS37808.1 polar amino acid transport system substrate-binding protein [Herbihabitans rhizosphaerae]
MSRRPRRTAAYLISTFAVAALTATACGGTTEKPSDQPQGQSCTPGEVSNVPDPKPLDVNPAADQALGAKVPANIKSKGTLTVATDASYAPNEYMVEGTGEIIGMDIDIMRAVAKTLGLQVKFENAKFDGILAGVQAGRYDLAISSFTDTKEREQVVDFVTYFNAGTGLMVRKCNPKGIKTIEDLCGKSVGAQQGVIQIDQLTKEDAEDSVVKKCKDAGKPPPNAQGYPQQTDVNNALQANRLDAYLADGPVVDFALKKTGAAFERVGSDIGAAPYGIPIPKTSGTLKEAVNGAIQKMITDGSYRKILDNWGTTSGAVTESKINGAK